MFREITLLALLTSATPETPTLWTELRQTAQDAKFDGMIMASHGESATWAFSGERIPKGVKSRSASTHNVPDGSGFYATTSDEGSASHGLLFNLSEPWRWASVTKQVLAVLILQEVAKGNIDLDATISQYLPQFQSANAGQIKVRALLQHQSGLPNPDDTMGLGQDFPSYYLKSYRGSRSPLIGYCAGPVKGTPDGDWAYNNCDYIVAGALLKSVSGKDWEQLFKERIAKPYNLKTAKATLDIEHTQEGYIEGKKEPAIALKAFGGAGALTGTIGDLWKFDRALMTGKLLPKKQLDMLWDGNPELGFMALGQWVFTVPLMGCDRPVKIVERRGAIGGVQIRNFILPENDAILIVFTNRAEFEFGEVWQGGGFSYDLLSKVACK